MGCYINCTAIKHIKNGSKAFFKQVFKVTKEQLADLYHVRTFLRTIPIERVVDS